MTGDLHRGDADAAGGAVHQHPLALAQPRELHQRVVRGEERRGHRCRRGKRPARGLGYRGPRRGAYPGGEGPRRNRHDLVAGGEPGHSRSHAQHDACDLDPESRTAEAVLYRFIGKQSHGVHDIAEIEARGMYTDLDPPRCERGRATGLRLLSPPAQVAERTWNPEIEVEARRRAIRHCCISGRGVVRTDIQPRHETPIGREEHLVLGIGLEQFLHQFRGACREWAAPSIDICSGCSMNRVSSLAIPSMVDWPNMAMAKVPPARSTNAVTSLDLTTSPDSRACSSRLAVGSSVCWDLSWSSAMARLEEGLHRIGVEAKEQG